MTQNPKNKATEFPFVEANEDGFGPWNSVGDVDSERELYFQSLDDSEGF